MNAAELTAHVESCPTCMRALDGVEYASGFPLALCAEGQAIAAKSPRPMVVDLPRESGK